MVNRWPRSAPTTPIMPTRPNGPAPQDFAGHLTLNVSNDGLVYAADRNANRIHVTTKEGEFLEEFMIAPGTGAGGSTGGVAFSPDPGQQFLYISDLTNNKIWFLNREDGTVVGEMGGMGENGGQFFGLHMIAVDPDGNIYTGEVFAGERVQRFVPGDSPKGALLQQLGRDRVTHRLGVVRSGHRWAIDPSRVGRPPRSG